MTKVTKGKIKETWVRSRMEGVPILTSVTPPMYKGIIT